ncbi:DUF1622 domain-containing protein [Methylobacter sp. sgz302048]|jgi:uncharacterized membrane protein|uniref:DUF1622 domain-containing protein n=1 Tax=Methylobacter sp. sgz302048 TaxID=3455945 RepID=UPI003F9FFC68
MSEFVKRIGEWCTAIIETTGVVLIAVLALYTLVFAAFRLYNHADAEEVFRDTRQRLGRGILLGLELFIAADVIHSAVVEVNFETVGVLAIIIVIRTFLSFSLEVELNGRWPWQNRE